MPADNRCSFCGKRQEQVHHLIAGPGRVYICDECVFLSIKVIEGEGSSTVPLVCSLCGTAPLEDQYFSGNNGVTICYRCIDTIQQLRIRV
jgi:hypothetical protein